MSFLKRFFSIVALLALASCGGGGGDSGTCPFESNCPGSGGGGGTATVSSIDIAVSAATMPNTGSGSVTVTVTALDANRNGVPNAGVSLSASSGLLTLLGTSGSVTGESGALGATLTLGGDLSAPRTITLTATANSGAISRTTTVSVVPSVSGATPASIELVASNTELGTGGEQVTISAFVKDANNNAMASTPISFSTSTGTLTALSALTSATGTASAVLAAGADKSNRDAVVTVQAGSITNTITIPVRGTTITLSGPSSLVLGQGANFDVSVRDSKSNIVTGVTITPTSVLRNPVSLTSSSGGTTTFRYTASIDGNDTLSFNAAGATVSTPVVVSSEDFRFTFPGTDPVTQVPVNVAQLVQVTLRRSGAPVAGVRINFAATGGTLSASSVLTDASGVASVELTSASAGPITVQATVSGTSTTSTLPLQVVATTPSKLVLQITPTAIAPNTTPESQNQAQVVAKVTDAAANPVAGVAVNFTRVVDASGGNLLQASAVTDSSGQATVIYRSGAESTASNGVTLRATVASTPAVTGTATLTVNQQSLFIAIGTGNTVTNVDPQTYKQDWTIYVTDANGVPVNGATLTLKAIPDNYLTGDLVWSGRVWVQNTNIRACRNEDANKNGVLDPGEDDNADGVLWPGNVIAVSPSSVQTVNGRATVSLTYAESYVPWIQLRLTATASVAGTESKTDALFLVAGLASDFNQETVPPASVLSPFGLNPKAGAVCVPYP